MKTFTQYINEEQIECLNEGFLSKLANWFKGIFKTQKKLENENLKVDVKQIKSPEKPMKLKDILAVDSEMELINDKNVGFPVASQIINQKDKYLTLTSEKNEDKKEYQPLVDRYFYVDGNNKYMIGQIMYDISIKNDNNFVNMINFEVLQKVENLSEVQKYINGIFEGNMKKQSFKGFQYNITHPRVKAVLIKLGYKTENNNKNIIFKLIK